MPESAAPNPLNLLHTRPMPEDPSTTPPLRPEDAPDSDVARARRMHERSGEIELIISGALLFGLLQLPGRADAWMEGATLRLGADLGLAVVLLWTYVRLMLLTLIVSFSLHLVARAYWVGLIGLDSAFPGGVRWDQIRYGELTKKVYRERLSTLPVMARRADDFASSIFSFAFWIVLVFLLSIVLSLVLGAGAMLVRRYLLPDVPFLVAFLTPVMLLALAPGVAIGLDRILEGRIDPEGGVARGLGRTVAGFYYLFGGPFFMPIQFTLFSNVPKRVMWPLYLGFTALLVTVSIGSLLARSGVFVLSPSEALPTRPGIRSVDARYFEDRRSSATSTAPSIPSDVIQGPYVRLTVPWVADRDVERLEALCPALPPLGRTGLVRASLRTPPPDPDAMQASLTCLGGLWSVSLNGEPLSPEWDFVSAPGDGVTGIVTYLPTRDLEPGAHVLEIAGVPTPEEREALAAGEDPEIRRHYIRFRR